MVLLDLALEAPGLARQPLRLVLGLAVLVGDRPLQGAEGVDVGQALDAGEDVEPVEVAGLVEDRGALGEDRALQVEVLLGARQLAAGEAQALVDLVELGLGVGELLADGLQFLLQRGHLGARALRLLLQVEERRSGRRRRSGSGGREQQSRRDHDDQRRGGRDAASHARARAVSRADVGGVLEMDHLDVLRAHWYGYRPGRELLDRWTGRRCAPACTGGFAPRRRIPLTEGSCTSAEARTGPVSGVFLTGDAVQEIHVIRLVSSGYSWGRRLPARGVRRTPFSDSSAGAADVTQEEASMKTLPGEDPRATSRLAFGLMLAVVISVLFVLAVTATPAQAVPLPGGSLDPATIPKYQEPLVIPPAMPRTRVVTAEGQADRLLRDRRQAVRAVHPADGLVADQRHRADHRVELRVDGRPEAGRRGRHAQLPGPDDRGQAGQAGAREVDQRPGRRERQLPAAPLRRGPDAALGQSRRRPGRHRHARHGRDALHRARADRDARARGAHHRGQRRLPGGLVPAGRQRHPGRLRHRRLVLRAVQAGGRDAAGPDMGARLGRVPVPERPAGRPRCGTTTTRSA